MSDIRYPYTIDELYNNYEFKVVKKALMREFPWIKDVFVDPEQLGKYNLIFLNFEIDPTILGEQMGWTLSPWVRLAYDEGKEYMGLYLSLFYDGVSYDDTNETIREMEQLMRSVHNSPALPEDLKIKGDRKFTVGNFYLNKGGKPWF